MRDSGFLSKAVLLAVAVLLTLIFARLAPQAASASLVSPPGAQPAAENVPEPQQFPIMDKIADKIIQKYQGSTCEQLWQEKAQAKNKPKSTQEQEAISILRNDAQMRAAFINKIAAPIANKMFECGMIP